MSHLYCKLRTLASRVHLKLTLSRPEFLSMTELSDNPELQMYTSAVLYVLSAVRPPKEYIELVLENFISAITLSSVRKRSAL